MATGLGNLLLIKHEDSGEAYYSCSEEIAIPDFRIVTATSEHWLVKVKSSPHDVFKISHAVAMRLRQHAILADSDLAIAVLWEKYGIWTLCTFDSFQPGESGG